MNEDDDDEEGEVETIENDLDERSSKREKSFFVPEFSKYSGEKKGK